ncbi:Uncharacterised protein [Actinomyces bovis]|uniref:Allophanate hydrolase subunit 2 n=1 Tax=Actinomyces bovis TaxID=1658 RepID=A0ABY1VMM8_9ACTO|nr:hypothetical protein [Actinomyces bovis]SPT52937.1 Uncharacterised protein [Actinomyces bovis]VEG55113.1 Uncharacterised protein [Actinomyces israelii]
MPEILRSGEWERQVLPELGALELNLLAQRTPAQLEVLGTATKPKYLGGGRSTVAFPVKSVLAGTPVTVRGIATGGHPFGVGETVDLVISAGGGQQSWVLRGLDIAGQVESALVRLERTPQGLVLTPGEGGNATLGLGGWCVRRRQESGQAFVPTITELGLDTSVSMRPHAGRLAALQRFMEEMAQTAGVPAPTVRRLPVGGAEAQGVGAVDYQRGGSERPVLLTDAPPTLGDTECLLFGPAELLTALPTPGALALTEAAWVELEREDRAFGTATLDVLTPLLDWLTRPTSEIGATR